MTPEEQRAESERIAAAQLQRRLGAEQGRDLVVGNRKGVVDTIANPTSGAAAGETTSASGKSVMYTPRSGTTRPPVNQTMFVAIPPPPAFNNRQRVVSSETDSGRQAIDMGNTRVLVDPKTNAPVATAFRPKGSFIAPALPSGTVRDVTLPDAAGYQAREAARIAKANADLKLVNIMRMPKTLRDPMLAEWARREEIRRRDEDVAAVANEADQQRRQGRWLAGATGTFDLAGKMVTGEGGTRSSRGGVPLGDKLSVEAAQTERSDRKGRTSLKLADKKTAGAMQVKRLEGGVKLQAALIKEAGDTKTEHIKGAIEILKAQQTNDVEVQKLGLAYEKAIGIARAAEAKALTDNDPGKAKKMKKYGDDLAIKAGKIGSFSGTNIGGPNDAFAEKVIVQQGLKKFMSENGFDAAGVDDESPVDQSAEDAARMMAGLEPAVAQAAGVDITSDKPVAPAPATGVAVAPAAGDQTVEEAPSAGGLDLEAMERAQAEAADAARADGAAFAADYRNSGLNAFGGEPQIELAQNAPYGMREDRVTPKGSGFLGPLQRPDGGVSSEISMQTTVSDIDPAQPQNFKPVSIPTLIKGLSNDEINYLLSTRMNKSMWQTDIGRKIAQKAIIHARKRLQNRLPFFATEAEQAMAMNKPPDAGAAPAVATAEPPLATVVNF